MDTKELIEKGIEDTLYYNPENSVEDIIKIVFECILKAERTEFLKDCEVPNKGNGYYERLARSINQYFTLKVPRDRLSLFKPVFLDAIKRQEEQIQDLAFKLYVKGLSTRDIEEVFADIYGKKMSPTSVSNITKEFQKNREAWQNRPLEKEYYFLYVDALWVSVRRDSVQKEAFYILLGLRTDLKREVLGVYNIPVESASGWQEVFRDLKNRGFQKTLMVIADGISNLEDVVNQEFPGVCLQKCLVHKVRDILLRARSKDKQALADDFKSVFKLEDPTYSYEAGVANLENFINKWKKVYPQLGNKFKEKHLVHYFAYLRFPPEIHRMIYTTNWIERLNKGIRRTENLRNSFPDPDSAMNLICAFLMDFEQRVYSYPVTSFLQVEDALKSMLSLNN